MRSPAPRGRPQVTAEPHDEMARQPPSCMTCGGEWESDVCPASQRPCGHHCNHMDYSGICHWCGAEMSAEGAIEMPVVTP